MMGLNISVVSVRALGVIALNLRVFKVFLAKSVK
jgi:hypothetical protein